MTTPATNTHYYDGKLSDILVQIVQNQQENNSDELTTEKNTLFTRLSKDIKESPLVPPQYRRTAVIAINKIMQSIRQPANYDRTNGLYADDVLYLVCKHIYETMNMEALQYLSEQLSDIITSGQCPQGRSTRVFQVFYST